MFGATQVSCLMDGFSICQTGVCLCFHLGDPIRAVVNIKHPTSKSFGQNTNDDYADKIHDNPSFHLPDKHQSITVQQSVLIRNIKMNTYHVNHFHVCRSIHYGVGRCGSRKHKCVGTANCCWKHQH